MTDPLLRKLTRVNDVLTWPYAIHFIPTNMVRTRAWGNLRMRKQNIKKTVPLDVVPERRTEWFPPRFRPVGLFCEVRFRYLSSPTGREGEISRPLDHMRQIPFIHSARLIYSTNFYINLFQKTLSERTANGSCRTEIARPKETVVSIFAKKQWVLRVTLN